jgi:HK97 family phage major capsid protein
MNLNVLKSDHADAVHALRDICEKAASEGRDLDDDEHERAQKLSGKVKGLKERIERAETMSDFDDYLVKNFGPFDEPAKPKEPQKGSWARAMDKYLEGMGAKALIAGGTLLTPAEFDQQAHDKGRPARFVSSVMPTQRTENDNVAYLRQTTRTNLAAAVAEGNLKPTSVFTVEKITAPFITVAHLSEQIPRQTLADSESLERFLESELRLGLQVELDDQIMSGNPAAGTPEMAGLGTLSGTQSQGFDQNNLRTCRLGIEKCELAFSPPSHFVLHPTDWRNLELAVSSTGEFLFDAGPVNRAEARLFGVPVVQTTSVAQGTGWVGDFTGQSRLYMREDVRVDFSENVSDDFAKNLVRFRAEARAQTAWLRAQAFCKLTSLSLGGS